MLSREAVLRPALSGWLDLQMLATAYNPHCHACFAFCGSAGCSASRQRPSLQAFQTPAWPGHVWHLGTSHVLHSWACLACGSACWQAQATAEGTTEEQHSVVMNGKCSLTLALWCMAGLPCWRQCTLWAPDASRQGALLLGSAAGQGAQQGRHPWR